LVKTSGNAPLTSGKQIQAVNCSWKMQIKAYCLEKTYVQCKFRDGCYAVILARCI